MAALPLNMASHFVFYYRFCNSLDFYCALHPKKSVFNHFQRLFLIIKEIFSKFKDNSKTNCIFLEFQEFSRTKVIFKDFSRSVRTLSWLVCLSRHLQTNLKGHHHQVMVTSYICSRKTPCSMDVNSCSEARLHQDIINLVDCWRLAGILRQHPLRPCAQEIQPNTHVCPLLH